MPEIGTCGELSNQDAGKERAGDGPKAEASELHATDQVADADRKKYGQLRIFDQELLEPSHDQNSSPLPEPSLSRSKREKPNQAQLDRTFHTECDELVEK